MSVASTPLTADPVSTRSTRVTGPPLVLTEEGFGFLSGDELTPIPGLSATMANVSPTSIQVAPDRDYAAVRLLDGSVARVPAESGVAVVDTRVGLVDPGADPFGFIWSVPHDQPTEVAVFSAAGERFDVTDAWPGATQIVAMALSRDGTRAAALVVAGGRPEVWIAGIVRGDDNQPLRLGAPVPLGRLSGAGSGLAWLDDTTVGVLTDGVGGPVFVEQLAGGPATTTDAPLGASSIAGATSISTVRLRAEDGSLYVKRGANWQRTTGGILVLATQQGSPQ